MRIDLFASLFVITTMEVGFSSSSNDAGNGKGCYYKGKYHYNTWEDGCEYICSCINTDTGYFRCSRRCQVYHDIQPRCSLETDSEDPCCMVPVCSDQSNGGNDVTAIVNDITTQAGTTVLALKGSETVCKHNTSNRNDSDISNTAASDDRLQPSSTTIQDVNADVSSVYSDNYKDTAHVINDIDSPRDTNVNPMNSVASQERNPIIIHEATGHKIGHLMAVKEFTPVELVSSKKIFIDFPTMDDNLPLENTENSSHVEGDNGKGNPQAENTSELSQADTPPPHVLPNPLNDLVNQYSSNDIDFAPKDVYDFSSYLATSYPTYVSLNVDNISLPENIQNSTNTVTNITENPNSMLKDIITHTSLGLADNGFANISNNASDQAEAIKDITGQSSSLNDLISQTSFELISNNTSNQSPIKTSHSEDVRNITSTPPIQQTVVDAYTSHTHGNISISDGNKIMFRQQNSSITTGTPTILNSTETHTVHDSVFKTVTEPITTHSKLVMDDIAVRPDTRFSKNNDDVLSPGRCVFMGMRFDSQQTWFDGCNQFCVCLDAKTGFFNCTKRCPEYSGLSEGCGLVVVTPGCCPRPNCTEYPKLPGNSTVIPTLRNQSHLSIAERFNRRSSQTANGRKHLVLQTKLPPAMQHFVISKITESPRNLHQMARPTSSKLGTIHTATGTYHLHDVIGSTTGRVGRLVPASLRNTSAVNGTREKNNSSILQTILGLCLYNGRLYTPGDKWEIGCDLVCRCLPGLQGQYACKSRCQKYDVIPFGCSLQEQSGDLCCKTLYCPNNTPNNTHLNITNNKPKNSFVHQRNSKSESDNEGTRHQIASLLAQLLRSNKALNSSSIRTISVKSSSSKDNSSTGNPIVNHDAVTINFTDSWGNNQTLDNTVPSGGRLIVQTGAVLISKQATTKRTAPIEIIATTGCVVGDKVYRRGQSWKIGCRFRCFCNDEIKQTMTCTQLCPKWKLPNSCELKPPPEGKCCPVPKCAHGYTIRYPDGYVPL